MTRLASGHPGVGTGGGVFLSTGAAANSPVLRGDAITPIAPRYGAPDRLPKRGQRP